MEQAPDRLHGFLLMVTLAALALAFPLSALLLSLYRRAVVRGMRRSGSSSAAAVAPASVAPDRADSGPAPTQDEVRASPLLALGPGAEQLFTEAHSRPWRSASVQAVAGLAYALVMATLWAWEPGKPPSALQITTLGVVFSWPIALATALVTVSTRRARAAVLGAYSLALLASEALLALLATKTSAGDVVRLWLWLDAPESILLLAFWHARIRAVGPLVLLFLLVAVLGSQVVIAALGADVDRLRPVAALGADLGLGAGAIFAMLMFLGFLGFAPIAWLLLGAIRLRYAAKSLDDQSLALHALWLLFAAMQAIPLGARGALWLLAAPAAFTARLLVAAAARRAFLRPPLANSRLLLLRVFALGRRSERLFAGLERHWRHIGSIQMIAGPDLATRTVEPHEFLEFVSGRLRRLFVVDSAALEQRISSLDLLPDRTGRFRVNDLFCQEDTWRPALARLLCASDAVLMDLRGFGPSHAGCVHELRELVARSPLDAIVLVVDARTDALFLDRTLAEAWKAIPQDASRRAAAAPLARLSVLHASGGDADLAQLLRCLCRAASRGAPDASVAADPRVGSGLRLQGAATRSEHQGTS